MFVVVWNWPDTVENIDENQEECDKEAHPREGTFQNVKKERERDSPARNNLRLDEKTDPGGDDEHEWGEIDLDQELHLFSLQSHLDPTGSIGSCFLIK